jgi:hypothetical protein
MTDKVFAEPPMELKVPGGRLGRTKPRHDSVMFTKMVGEKLACLEELLSLEVVSSLAVSLRQQCLAFPSSARLEKES